MRLTSEDLNDLYVNRVDTFHISDCVGMKFAADPKFANHVGLMVRVRHEESNISYKQLFFLKPHVAMRMLHALDFHLNDEQADDSNI